MGIRNQEIVMGLKYSNVTRDSLSVQVVHIGVTLGTRISRMANVLACERKQAEGIMCFPKEMVDHIPYLTKEKREQLKKLFVKEVPLQVV